MSADRTLARAPNNDLPQARLGWIMALIQTLIYGSFVGTFIASPATMTRPVAPGMAVTVATVGGLLVILSTMVLTGLYVLLANRLTAR
ncbi:hypothetical protein OPKNFCMD_0730 [Methylobacterium crusticola]|uniref:DUF485 domain-containing protein n=1 Tax=Methylobacterium crusticola TaxID=1697972 RepID=A0ABQ4QRR5_9HYPH|nr:DUF485 domain-containing protein [Methylobacterium crusticola]GJD48016.1 hypothetical protein OPKNFCMD_0730 [Methylobacterium crusticola]